MLKSIKTWGASAIWGNIHRAGAVMAKDEAIISLFPSFGFTSANLAPINIGRSPLSAAKPPRTEAEKGDKWTSSIRYVGSQTSKLREIHI